MSDNLTQGELATNAETWEHIDLVIRLLIKIQEEIHKRMLTHDRSKLRSPEVNIFRRYPYSERPPYGTPEYDERLKELAPALEHHYRHNRHHPQHFPDGVEGMNIIDLLEMLCDWKASSEGDRGNIYKSIEIGAKRFGLSDQLTRILINSAPLLEDCYTGENQDELYPDW